MKLLMAWVGFGLGVIGMTVGAGAARADALSVQLLSSNVGRVTLFKNVMTGTECAAQGLYLQRPNTGTPFYALQVSFDGPDFTPDFGIDRFYADFALNQLPGRDTLRFRARSRSTGIGTQMDVEFKGSTITRVLLWQDDVLTSDCQ
jgi:hypothetical protein